MVRPLDKSALVNDGARLFFGPGGFELFPNGIGEHAQIVELTGTTEPLTAVNHNAFAIDVFGHVAEEKRGEIGKFFMFAEAFHGMAIQGMLFELL